MCLLHQETASIYVQERQKRTLTWSELLFFISPCDLQAEEDERRRKAKISYIGKTNITHFLRFHETFGLQEIPITTYISRDLHFAYIEKEPFLKLLWNFYSHVKSHLYFMVKQITKSMRSFFRNKK